jgi:hypothetical protein
LCIHADLCYSSRDRLRRHARPTQKKQVPLQTEHEVLVERDELDARVPTPDLPIFPPFTRRRGARLGRLCQLIACHWDRVGAFTSGFASVEDDFDGTPGEFSTFNDEAAEGVKEAEVVREALPSPGLSRGAGGLRFGNGGGNGMGMGGFRGVPPPFGDPSGVRWRREVGSWVRMRYGIYSGAVRGFQTPDRSISDSADGSVDGWIPRIWVIRFFGGDTTRRYDLLRLRFRFHSSACMLTSSTLARPFFL